MDVDGDVDSQLLQQFGSMATTDKDVLISDFKTVLGNQLSEANCAFFLDMNNWNLPAAICSYFECEQSIVRSVPKMSFVKDITIGEGESVPPNTRFTKTWRVQNSGEEPWPEGCHLRFVSGDRFGTVDSVAVESLAPGCCADISTDMISPHQTGIHQSQWRMVTASGLQFGEIIWMILQVDEGGVLAVTQQFSQFGQEFAASSLHHMTSDDNPFTSPDKFPTACPVVSDDTRLSNGLQSVFPRHSSLPSSPRGHSDVTFEHDGDVYTRDVSQHQRSLLFQTPGNSPSKTINSSKSDTTQNQAQYDYDMS